MNNRVSSLVGGFKKDLVRSRGESFLANAIVGRTIEEAAEDPDVIVRALAWEICAALSAAEICGVSLDLDEAVSTGLQIYRLTKK